MPSPRGRSFVALSEHELHAETDSQAGKPTSHGASHHIGTAGERRHGARQGPHAGQTQYVGFDEGDGVGLDPHVLNALNTTVVLRSDG